MAKISKNADILVEKGVTIATLEEIIAYKDKGQETELVVDENEDQTDYEISTSATMIIDTTKPDGGRKSLQSMMSESGAVAKKS